MNIFQEVFLTTSIPVDVQIILGLSWVIIAVTVLNLAVESFVRPPTRNTMTMSMIADYWIRRQKFRGFGLQFCSRCGSTLCGIYRGEVHGVTLGCVNGDPQVEIGQHIFVGSKAAWEILPEGVTMHEAEAAEGG